MSDPKKESPYANISWKEYGKRMAENRKKYPEKKAGIFGTIKNIFLWWINIGASFMGLDKKNLMAEIDDEQSGNYDYSIKHSNPAAFRASQHTKPRERTYEEMYDDERRYEAIKKMTDGQGDHDCKCK